MGRTFPGPSRILFIWSLYLASSASSFLTLTSIESILVSVAEIASVNDGFGGALDDPNIRFCVVSAHSLLV